MDGWTAHTPLFDNLLPDRMNSSHHAPDMTLLAKIPSKIQLEVGNQWFFSEKEFGYQYDQKKDGNTEAATII